MKFINTIRMYFLTHLGYTMNTNEDVNAMDVLGRLHQLMEERNLNPYRLSKQCGLAQSTVSNMYKRNNIPTVPTLEILCKGLGITMSQFFAEETEPITLSAEQRLLLERYSALSLEEKKAVFSVIDAILRHGKEDAYSLSPGSHEEI